MTTLLPFVITRGSYVEVLPEMQKAVAAGSLVDMVFHAIITREAQIEEIPRLAHEFGVRSFKTFMAYKGREISPSGIQGMSDDQIFSVFRQVAKILGAIAIVHCENMEMIELHQQPFIAANRQDTAAWSDARPVFGELEAIRRMVAFAEAVGIDLLIPHMGVGLGSEFLRQKAWGCGRVATETCPHYLLYSEDDLERLVLEAVDHLRGGERDAHVLLVFRNAGVAGNAGGVRQQMMNRDPIADLRIVRQMFGDRIVH